MRAPLLVTALLCLLPALARAHDADIVYAQVQREPGASAVDELLTMTHATLSLLAPVDLNRDGYLEDAELSARADSIRAGVWQSLPLSAGGRGCELQGHQARNKEGYVELRARFLCGEGELVQTFRVLSILPPNYKVVLGTFVNGEAGARFAQGIGQTLVLDEPKPGEGGGPSGLGGWILLGVEHIFGGPDHLAFVLALLLGATGLRRVLLLVTSFTLAHSVTLGVTAAGVLTLTPGMERWVELAIAVSIVWVAVENLVLHDPRHRAVLTFAFGLLHGFGFASALRGYGIERQLATALFGFNAGVELGQAAVVLVAVPLFTLLRRSPRAWRIFPRVVSVAIAGAGMFWLVQRALG